MPAGGGCRSKSLRQVFKSGTAFYLLACLGATVYILIVLSPMFSYYFTVDDLAMFDLGVSLKHNPTSFLTFSFGGWWRPIGFTIPAIIYILFGLAPFPFHILGFLVHLMAAAAAGMVAGRLFDHHTGFIAFIFYIASTVAISSIGFISNVYQDELAAIFILLALFVQIRTGNNHTRKAGPYIVTTIFLLLSAACKESWMAYIPLAIYIELLNYQKSDLGRRLLRLSPILIVFSMFYFRFLVMRADALTVPLLYFSHTFGGDNLLWGITLPFLPFGVPYDKLAIETIWDGLRLLVPVAFSVAAWILLANKRKEVGLVLTAFLSFLFVMGSSFLNNGFWGWVHLPSLVAFAAILMAAVLGAILRRFPVIWAYSSVLVFILAFNWLQYFTIQDGMHDYRDKTRSLKVYLQSFQSQSHNLAPGSILAAFDGPPVAIAIDALVPQDIIYRRLFNKNAGASMEEFLRKDMSYVRIELSDLALSPDTHYIGVVDGAWHDFTQPVKDKLATEELTASKQ